MATPNIGGALTGRGGISPQQMSLAQYNLGQGEVGNAAAFSGMPVSTGHTQADVGSGMQAALTEASLSNADAAALSQFFNQQAATAAGGLGSILGGKGGGGGGGGLSGGGGVA